MENYQEMLNINEAVEIPETLSLLPVRDLVVFPFGVMPLLVGREKSLTAVDFAKKNNNLLLVATQKDSEKEEIRSNDIFRVGTICRIREILEFPNGHSKVVVEGIKRAKISRFLRHPECFLTRVNVLEEQEDGQEIPEVYQKQMLFYFQEYIGFTPELPDEMLEFLHHQDDPLFMINFISLIIQADAREKQKILQEPMLEKRIKKLLDLLREIIGFHRVRQDIDQKVQESLLKNQKNYYLQEKLKIINRELEEEDEVTSPELKKLEEEILAADMPDHAFDKAAEEFAKLKKIPAFSPEYTVIRNYLDWMNRIPWKKQTEDKLDISEAQKILDGDHYGLKKPKERIVEHLAVLQRVKEIKGPILCLVGPPGVGKTSLGKSIARALGRNFVRVSLGGVRDEAEIRGHRRTYIGSMPGKIIQSMKKAGSKNPVFLLDEIDKMSTDFRGDPASAMLEVLDPEQNRHFNDHYLDVDYDLSKVFFVTTANTRSNIPLPLQDRMEIIELPGYLEYEKLKIAIEYLVPKQFKEHGLTKKNLPLEKKVITRIIREYTREAGVRNLERQVANLCRKAVRYLAEKPDEKKLPLKNSNLEKYLGKPEFFDRKQQLKKEVGLATALAWTPYGGDILKIEVNVIPGKGKLILTGKLGDVMQESAQTALSYIRGIAKDLKISPDVFEKNDIHIHVPEGGVPKDGPSAGIALTSAVISALTGRPVRNTIALTGEITLRGKVLAIGGLNEKILAAKRNNISAVILPEENKKEIDDLPKELRNGIKIFQVSEYSEVMKQILA